MIGADTTLDTQLAAALWAAGVRQIITSNPADFRLFGFEYIIVHELTHLLERNHNDRFAAIMDRHLPSWRACRQELNAEPLANETWSY